jgi:hypothetical protein
VSGGAIPTGQPQATLVKIAPDGSSLLYSTGLDAYPAALAVTSGGTAVLAGYTSDTNLTTTAGVVQPRFDPSPRSVTHQIGGFVTRVNTADSASNSFLVAVPRNPLAFSYRIGDDVPQLPTLDIGSSSAPLPIQATFSQPWLIASADGATPTKLRFSLNSSAVQPGSFAGTLSVSSPALPYPPVTLPFTTTIAPRPTFSIVNIRPVSFQWETGLDLPPTQIFEVDSNQSSFSFIVSSNAPWLSGNVTPSSTRSGSELRIFAGPAPAGSYTGTLSISLNGVPNSTQTVSVQYTVLPAAELLLSTTQILFTNILGKRPPAAQTVQVSSSPSGAPVAVSGGGTVDLNCKFDLSAQMTPAVLTISINPAPTLAAGVYQCQINVRIGQSGSTNVQVFVFIAHDVPIEVNPLSVSYRFVRGGGLTTTRP